MIFKFEYTSNSERENIIQTKKAEGLTLIEEQNILSGNFLIFENDVPVTNPELTALQENQLVLMDAIATLYEDLVIGVV